MILALATEVPKASLPQKGFSAKMARFLSFTETQEKLLERIALGSQIRKRHSVVADFSEEGFQGTFFEPDLAAPMPKTGKRNDLYKAEAPKLAESVCKKALTEWGGDPQLITHVISVSCTGMMAPGIEFLLIQKLGLSRDVERLGINFMGCFGAFKGLAIAKALALESPKNRVLLVCTELCSLHFQGDTKTDTLVANSLFADGTAAVIVGVKPSKEESPLFEIHSQGSTALDETLDLMTWEGGDFGYQMRLSAQVPAHLEKHIASFSKRLMGDDLPFDQCTWAIHPGGSAILDSITRACNLQREQLKASWTVLAEYGNMSSPTFLFVLEEILKTPCNRKWALGLGFGPGLSIEGVLLKRVDKNVAK